MSEVAQSCPTLCDPMDCSLPDSSIHGIFQARILECVAIYLTVKFSGTTYIHIIVQLTIRMDWVWPRNFTGSGMRPQVNKMSWNQPYWTSLLTQWLRFPASNAGGSGGRVWSLVGEWRSCKPCGTAKKFKINKDKFLKIKLWGGPPLPPKKNK